MQIVKNTKLIIIWILLVCSVKTHAQATVQGCPDSVLAFLKARIGPLAGENVSNFSFYRYLTVRDEGKVATYKGELLSTQTSPLPTNARGPFYLIKGKSPKMFLLFLDSLVPVRLKKGEDSCYLGGYLNSRGLGKFVIYGFKDDSLTSLFETKEYVYNYSLDCNSYDNSGYLKFQNTDENADSYLDLLFCGRNNIYCNGLELGFSREDRSPIRTEKIKIIYYYDPMEKFWKE
jgi:hypothetical protein